MIGDEWILENAYGSHFRYHAYFHGEEDIGLKLNHMNYLKTLFVNHAEGTNMDERVYEWFDYSLAEYVSDLRSKKGIIHDFIEMYHGVRMNTYVIPEVIYIIRSIISFVAYLHSKKVTFVDKFKLDYRNHFCLSEGVVKVWRTKFKWSVTHADRRRDYNQISRIIKNDLFEAAEFGRISECMGDLIDRMSSKNYHEKTFTWLYCSNRKAAVSTEDFFSMHIALLSPTQRLTYIKSCINKLDGLHSIDQSTYNEVI